MKKGIFLNIFYWILQVFLFSAVKRWITVAISRRTPWEAVKRWGWNLWFALNLLDLVWWTETISDPLGHKFWAINQRLKIQVLGKIFWISFSPREIAIVKDLGTNLDHHHHHFFVDLHLAGLQTLWSKMSNLAMAMVMGILVHFPWHPLHHLPQLEVVLQWRSLVTHKLQWGLKVLIVSIGIGATAAFQLLHNSFYNNKEKEDRVLKASGDFWCQRKLILIQCFLVIYVNINWSVEKLFMS